MIEPETYQDFLRPTGKIVPRGMRYCPSCERNVPKGWAHTCYDAKAAREVDDV